MTDLSSAPLVIIWRRVLELSAAKRTVQRINGWPLVGEDNYSAMYDAGNVLVGYWSQAEFFTESRGGKIASASLTEIVPTTACTVETGTVRTAAYNPSNQLILGVQDTGPVAQRLSSLVGHAVHPTETRERAGSAISFIDDVGNTTRFLRLSKAAAGSTLGQRLGSLRDGGPRRELPFNPALGYELLVSDLDASRRFYADVLGLHTELTAQDEVVLDTGNLLLTLRKEPALGLVTSIQRTGKLGDDLVVFHSNNLDSAVADLAGRGVAFPHGIEESPVGRLAVFRDPDGHTLSAWQSPASTQGLPIDFASELDRLLASAAANVSVSR
jgi:predicted enzyme related to lactoylglutathione lyase